MSEARVTLRLRRLACRDAAEAAVGRALVREYVLATHEEMRSVGGVPAVDLPTLWRIIPDLDDFEDRYGHDRAAFLVAEDALGPLGALGLTAVDRQTVEMHRLWVRPPARRRGVARALVEASLDEARRLGYRRIALDVLPQRRAAIALYRSAGFVDAPPRHEYPFPMVFLGREL